MTTKYDSVTEIQLSDLDTSMEIEGDDSLGWRSLPQIPPTSADSDTCATDEMEWLDDSFYQQAFMVSNLVYAKLKLSNFAVKLHDCNPIIVLFSYQSYMFLYFIPCFHKNLR